MQVAAAAEGGVECSAMASSPTAADWSLADACLAVDAGEAPPPPGNVDAGDLADAEDDDQAPPRAVRRLSPPPPPAGCVAGRTGDAESKPPLPKPEPVCSAADAEDMCVIDWGEETAAESAAAAAADAESPAARTAVVKSEAVSDADEDVTEDVAAAATNIFKYMSYETASDPTARRRVLKSLAASLAGGCGSKRPRPASPPPPGRYPLTSAELLFLAAGSPAAAAAAKAAALPGNGA